MWKVASILTGMAFVAAMFFLPGPEERRVALVIGNEAYVYSKPKISAASDSQIIGKALEKRGFEVVQAINLSRNELQNHIRKFARMAKNADAALLYYSGKMVQFNGRNYLSPIDAGLWSNTDVEFHTVPIDPLLSEMRLLAHTSLVFFDACRENSGTVRNSKNKNKIKKSSSPCRGISPIDNKNKMMISYSTRPGADFPDQQEKNSPFATALATHIHKSGAALDAVMDNIREEVIAQTNQRQIPWEDSLLQRQFVFHAAADGKAGQLPQQEKSKETKVVEGTKETEKSEVTKLPESTDTKSANKVLANFSGPNSFDFRQTSQKNPPIRSGEPIKPKASVKLVSSPEIKSPPKAQEKSAETEKQNTRDVPASEMTINRIEHSSKDLHQIAKADVERHTNTAPKKIKKILTESDLTAQVQEKLAQLTCFGGTIDGVWGRRSKRALRRFSYRTKEVLPSSKPSAEVIELLSQYSGPVCSVSCPKSGRITKTGTCPVEVAHEKETTAGNDQKLHKKKRAYKYKRKKSYAKKKRQIRKKSRYAKRKRFTRAKRRRVVRKRRYYRRRAPRAYYVRGGVILIYPN